MATNPVNLVDALGTVIPRLARNRAAVLRMGEVVSVAAEFCTVKVSNGNVTAGYHTFYRPRPLDIVDLINDGDKWMVNGCVASAANQVAEPTVQFGGVVMAPNAATAITAVVTFPKSFLGLSPSVAANLASGAGGTTRWMAKAYNSTLTGCGLWLVAADNVAATFSATVQWIAAAYLSPVVPTALEVQRVAQPEDGHSFATLTCHTSGCVKDDEAVPGVIVPDDPPIGWKAACGVCGNQITDIQ